MTIRGTKRKILKVKRKSGDKYNISNYPLVVVKWYDIMSESLWISIEDAKKMKLPTCTTKGHLLSQTKGVTRVFGDYAEDENGDIDELGNTTIIPTSVIVDIKKIVDKS